MPEAGTPARRFPSGRCGRPWSLFCPPPHRAAGGPRPRRDAPGAPVQNPGRHSPTV